MKSRMNFSHDVMYTNNALNHHALFDKAWKKLTQHMKEDFFTRYFKKQKCLLAGKTSIFIALFKN